MTKNLTGLGESTLASSPCSSSSASFPTESSQREQSQQLDLLHIVYTQSAVDVSSVEVNMLNMTAFVSLDAILDLTDILTANAFAVMDVIAAPPSPPVPLPPLSTTSYTSGDLLSTPSLGPVNAENRSHAEGTTLLQTKTQTPEIYPTMTMNVVVKVTNPRLILLEDPTTEESRAIVGSCGVVVHYSRSTTGKELVESLHISIRDNRVFVLPNMAHWKPQPVLEPMTLEINLKRRTGDK